MKKSIVFMSLLLFFVGGAYVGYVLLYLPKVVKANEDRILAVQHAISEVSKDQLLLSQTISDIADRVIASGKGKEDMVRELLSNPVVNRLALNYMGIDFATQKGMFYGAIKHARSVKNTKTDVRRRRIGTEKELKAKLKKLESKKRFLLATRSSAVSGYSHSQWAVWQREMDDIDSQIHYLRELVLGENLQRGKVMDKEDDAKAQYSKTILEIATEYEKNTIVQLERAIASRRMAYMEDEARIVILRDRFNAMAFWPLSVFLEK